VTTQTTLPETILQFGSGRFFRAFADLFIHQANAGGQAVGRVVIAQSTGGERAGGLNDQGGRYHVLVRGLENGTVVERLEPVSSVSRALVASTQWDEVRALARSPQLRVVLSNTTETGYDLFPGDRPEQTPPRSFPAKLLLLLRERYAAALPGLTIVPCELREHNADLLRKIVTQLAADWDLPAEFRSWLTTECVWLNTLVDRIVTATPADHPLLATDRLLTVCEPYALWAIQDVPRAGHFLEQPAVIWTANVEPYFLRKVRILNGAHTALAIRALPLGFQTVRQAVNDPEMGAWLERLLFEEVVPVLVGRVNDPEGFARQTLERFRNPFLEHKLTDIVVHHAAKVPVRLVPTWDEFRRQFGRTPPLLEEVLTMPQPG
jgi:tagaturonate reductase